MSKFILSLDQGTTSSRAIIFNSELELVSSAQREFPQIFPQPGWVEHDPMDIWSTQLGTADEALSKAGLTAKDISGIGITNQRETTILWDRNTGIPVANAIVWQDRRTAEICKSLKDQGYSDFIRSKTGLIIDPYFSAAKVQWIFDNNPEFLRRAQSGEIIFGTVDSWLLWNLTGGLSHCTDASNASRTMLFDIISQSWDKELLTLFNLPASILPQVKPSCGFFGEVSIDSPLRGIPVCGIAGDQQAALFGQCCFVQGMLKNTYGTGGFLMFNTGEKPVQSKNHLITTIAWNLDGVATYALEGSVFIAGAVVQWLRDSLGIIKSSGEVEELAQKVEDNGGVYFVPAFTGLGAPHWDDSVRGIITGLTRGATSAHIARAALESIVYQSNDVLQAMREDAGSEIKELRVDGGACVNDLLLQFQSDISQTTIVRPQVIETSALGAAMLAGLGGGVWKDIKEMEKTWKVEQIFEPEMKIDEVQKLQNGWQEAIRQAKYNNKSQQKE